MQRSRSKKAEVASQIFVYIIAMVVVSMVIIFGYKAIKNFASRSDEVALIKFKTDIETTFRQVGSNFNTIKITDFSVPSGYEELCILDLDRNPPPDRTRGDFDYNLILSEGADEKKNLFLIKGIYLEPFKVGKVKLDSDGNDLSNLAKPIFKGNGKDETGDSYILCFDVKNGKVKLKLKGKGDSVFVSYVDKCTSSFVTQCIG